MVVAVEVVWIQLAIAAVDCFFICLVKNAAKRTMLFMVRMRGDVEEKGGSEKVKDGE